MAFVKIMQITVLPFLVASIVFGIGNPNKTGMERTLKAFALALLLFCSAGMVLNHAGSWLVTSFTG
jgi:Na+/H+-dicarboxylate symporter